MQEEQHRRFFLEREERHHQRKGAWTEGGCQIQTPRLWATGVQAVESS